MREAPVLIGEHSWVEMVELSATAPLAVLPVGAVEQHGPHLPLLVDAITVEALAYEASRRTGAAVAPTLVYASSQGHSRLFPGTMSLTPETTQAALVELVQWLVDAGFRKVLLLNGHLGNTGVLWNAVDILVARLGARASVQAHSWWDLTPELWRQVSSDAPTADREFHANWAETSLMLFLRQGLVRMDRAVNQEERPWAFAYDMARKSRSGVIGRRVTESTAEAGRELFEQAVAALERTMDAMAAEEPPPPPPTDVPAWRAAAARAYASPHRDRRGSGADE